MSRKKYLNLLHQLAVSRFKLKDQSALLGFLWSFLHPLIMLGILFAMFRYQTGHSVEHYAIYLLVGLVQYTHFSNCTSRAMTVLYSMRQLTADAIFPKEVLVLSSVIADTIELLLAMIICVVIAGFSGISISWAILMLPFVWVLQFMLVSSVALVLSSVYVFARDIGHIYNAFLRLLIFITPIFYDPSFLGEGLGRYILFVNPLTYLINFSRTLIIEGRPLSFQPATFLLLASCLLLFFSFRIFKRYESMFSERL